MSNDTELRPCPFCGEAAHGFIVDGRPLNNCIDVECRNEDCPLGFVLTMSATQWNTRPPSAPISPEVTDGHACRMSGFDPMRDVCLLCQFTRPVVTDGMVSVPRGWLEATQCPDVNCRAGRILPDGDQCQWCHEKEQALAAAPTQPIDCATKAAAQGIDCPSVAVRDVLVTCIAIMDEKGRADGRGSRSLFEGHWEHIRSALVDLADASTLAASAKPDSPSVMVDREDLEEISDWSVVTEYDGEALYRCRFCDHEAYQGVFVPADHTENCVSHRIEALLAGSE